MKKVYLYGATAMLFASCANDVDLNPVINDPQPVSQVPMNFGTYSKNMSRYAVGLETEWYDFGVWAYKSQNDGTSGKEYDGGKAESAGTDASKLQVMIDYMVGFHGDEVGYNVAGVTTEDNKWYYEGMEDATFTAGIQATAHMPSAAAQYLKYWDQSYPTYYFYGYAPYVNGASKPAFAYTADSETTYEATITYPAISAMNAPAYMYAYTMQGSATIKDVPMQFKYIGNNIRLAFYEVIDGYSVEVENFSATSTDVWTLPATAGANVGDHNVAATYKTVGTPVVKLDINGTTGECTASCEYTGQTVPATANDCRTKWPIAEFTQNGAHSVKMGTTNAANDLLYSSKHNVIPQNPGCGFTLNISFVLKSEDTKEEIHVKGARAFVPADKCVWTGSNTLYTYIFKITKDVKGTTETGDPTLDVTPSTDKALYPIIFEDVTLVKQTEVTEEFNVN